MHSIQWRNAYCLENYSWILLWFQRYSNWSIVKEMCKGWPNFNAIILCWRPSRSKSHSLEHLNRPHSGHSVSDQSSSDLSGDRLVADHRADHRGDHGADHEQYARLGQSCCARPRIVPHHQPSQHHRSRSHEVSGCHDIACVIYQPNILGIAGPRYECAIMIVRIGKMWTA